MAQVVLVFVCLQKSSNKASLSSSTVLENHWVCQTFCSRKKKKNLFYNPNQSPRSAIWSMIVSLHFTVISKPEVFAKFILMLKLFKYIWILRTCLDDEQKNQNKTENNQSSHVLYLSQQNPFFSAFLPTFRFGLDLDGSVWSWYWLISLPSSLESREKQQ